MNLKLEIEFSKADILHDVDALKKQIDDMRPLPPDVEGRVMQKLRLDWNYHSNAIEGNQLSYGETVAFLMEGITAKGKPLKDHLDIRGHNEAINFLLSIVKEDNRPISESDIRALHQMILVEPYEIPAQTAEGNPTTKRITPGEYKTLPNHVRTATGETHYYATPEETPAKMQELMEWYNAVSLNPDVHPIVAAALFHHKFVAIHPFDDGNGRLSRILMNLILMQKGYPPAVVKMDDRKNYYALLNRADRGDSWPFVEYIAERLSNSLNLFLKAAMGEEIDEEDDINKKIALFKKELDGNLNIQQKKSGLLVKILLSDFFVPLTDKIYKEAKKFEDLFLDFSLTITAFTNRQSVDKFESTEEFKDAILKTEDISVFDSLQFVGAVLNFKEFRNTESHFDVNSAIELNFDRYRYKISIRNSTGNGVELLSNLYHERPSSRDANVVIKYFVENMITETKEKLKGPKS